MLVSAPGQLRPGDDRLGHAAVRAGAPAGRKPRNTSHSETVRRRKLSGTHKDSRVSGCGASNLCHRSRHVDRRFFKVRELFFEGELKVEKVDTALNVADLLTKALDFDVMMRHARRAFGYV